MMNDTLKLTDAQVLAHARDLLQEHLPLAVDGNCCTTDDLLSALLGIAVNRSTLEAVCTDWVAAPDNCFILQGSASLHNLLLAREWRPEMPAEFAA